MCYIIYFGHFLRNANSKTEIRMHQTLRVLLGQHRGKEHKENILTQNYRFVCRKIIKFIVCTRY